ncbi:hypothetical protein HIM_11093 [Hirsutella minnesotensis 3608]|uniref:Uncharacterized protein n=1 Tax=Hirsutella minnesotensis 3608 TaxID=1043627 RepID=A0A0F7ZFP8_9HYPO|nr:hypothetical protein HIM_11093 [Hirsutella minnesotensis 3608]
MAQKATPANVYMMTFVQPDCPSRFGQDEHRIKGLNAETIARVLLPPPFWLLTAEYLRSDTDEPPTSIFFSLNLLIYSRRIISSEWPNLIRVAEAWLFMNDRIHPYALTWEVAQHDGLKSDTGDTMNHSK